MKKFVSGLVVGAVLASGGLAAASSIDVYNGGLKFIVNGIDKTPMDNTFDNNGSKVPASFIYEGTTYVPIRLAANLLGTNIAYDGTQKAVVLGQKPEGTYLSDIKPFYTGNSSYKLNNDVANYIYRFTSMKMGGKDYSKGIAVSATNDNKLSFALNGNYSSLNFDYGLDDIDNNKVKKITIYGDDKELWSGDAVPATLPKNATINVTGVLKLDIKMTGDWEASVVDIGNPVLK